uniref:disease resistance protein Roq1-like n=1 Tax=Erigeron canadensis TaxID=72917 RepID=UPI001CB89C0B|nr:disease resistance protein Roq1-like [Erigeron canadensis]
MKDLVPFQSSLSNVQADSLREHEGIQWPQSRWWTSTFWPSFLPRIPSLSCLRLLKRLDLSHCNLSELSQDSIGSLLYLEHLKLNGNDFTSLPASLSQLSRLQMLGLVGCKKLEVLPGLPPNITRFDAFDCTALRQLHKQQILNSNYNLFYDLTNCPKLVDSYTIESMVSMLVPQRSNYMGKKLHIVLQGTRIPQWFTNQSTGNHVKIKD